ncbi:MAG TPA: DUF4231 domain-containing protein [Geobacteraceae bacterium]|nr:DUF4231 domain-containing protein [Geobacteraceae bacterium]
MSDKSAYNGQGDPSLSTMIDVLDDLSVLQKRFLYSRWLDQLSWMEGKAKTCQTYYYGLRLMAIIGGVIVPALVGLKLGVSPDSTWLFRFTFFLSLLVAISVAVEEFFHYGERWRHYRRIVETLKSEGWQFFQLAGAYQKYSSHSEAYTTFAARTEEILNRDVESFLTQVVQEKKGQTKGEEP